MDVIAKIKKAGLLGKSGGNFPVWLKWQQVKSSKAKIKYVIGNGSESEPGVFKDCFILKKYPEEVVQGLMLALKTVGAKTAFLYLNKKYYRALKKKLILLTKNLPIELFEKPEGYLKGQETVIFNVIEGKNPEPRIKPPFPTESGLWGKPTLVNNVETLYWVSKIHKNEYLKNRFYCVTGAVKHRGVFELPEDFTIKDVLKVTGNWPRFDFFIQVGGKASGEILFKKELNQKIKGLAAIVVFNKKETEPIKFMKKRALFFQAQNCSQCVPCREGVFRILEIMRQDKISKEDKITLRDIFEVMEKTSLCPLGRMIPLPLKTALEKL